MSVPFYCQLLSCHSSAVPAAENRPIATSPLKHDKKRRSHNGDDDQGRVSLQIHSPIERRVAGLMTLDIPTMGTRPTLFG